MLTIGIAMLGLLAPADAALARQQPPQPICLHTPIETAEDRIRRERAEDFVRRVHVAQALQSPRPQTGPRYRGLEELPLPRVPEGFDVHFVTDGRSYAVSLKDRRDPCRFAVFSDQEGVVYAGVPQPGRTTIVPLDTR